MKMRMSQGGMTVVELIDTTARTIVMYTEGQSFAYRMTYQDQESPLSEAGSIAGYSPTIVGQETIDGKACTVIQYVVQGTTTTAWIWNDKGLPIKIVSTTGTVTITLEYKTIDFSPIDDSVFELPPGITFVTLPTGMP